MRGHVDAESLALYAERQLSRGATARVRTHLSGCPECTRAAAELTAVTTQLSHVPVPPMPSAVAARLDAALSAEAAGRAAAPAAAAAGAPRRRRPRRNPLWSPGALRILAAAGVALVAAGGIGYAVSHTGSSTASPSSAGAARPAVSAVPAPLHSTVAGPIIPPGSHAIHPSTPPGTRYARSGTDYGRGTLAAQARQKLAEYTAPGRSGPRLLKPASISPRVRGCVAQTAKSRPVLLVDQAHYQHQPAIVIVLGSPDTVAVVSYSCRPLSARLPLTAGPAAK